MRPPHILLAFSFAVLGLGVPCNAAQPNFSRDIQPKIEALHRQAYIAVRSRASLNQLGKVIPNSIGRVAAWLGAHGVRPSGPPFVRYLVVDMPSRLDLEVGFPVAVPTKGIAPFVSGALPAGRYLTYIYTGSPDGLVGANAAVLDWARRRRVSLDQKPSSRGTVWGGREESYLTDPSHEPDPKKYKTKILYRLAG